MPPRKKIPAPIDRPLARAYLRQFTGWSTAFPPGQSEPTSLRVMENMFVDRNGALAVRPGLKYLSYTRIPNGDPENIITPGLGLNLPIVGTQEPFYTNDNKKALLFAVRETNGTVGFRVLLFTNDGAAVVRTLTDPDVGFSIPQGETAIRFSADTTYVKYLQIDNKIVALSDNPEGEDMRLFYVGAEKRARRIGNISVPLWEDSHKLKVVHPDYAWIADQEWTTRRNNLLNPSFEVGGQFWARSANSSWASPANVGTTISGVTKGQLKSLPTRTNMIHAPLHAVTTLGITGWNAAAEYPCTVSRDGSYLKVYDSTGNHTFLAYGAKMTFGVVAGQKYRVALDFDLGTNVTPYSVLTFYNAAGAIIGSRTYLTMPKTKGRFTSAAVTAPTGTTSMRLSLGGKNESKSNTFVKFSNIVVCKDGEATTIFSGDNTGTPDYYFWEGTANASPSTYHPPVDISLTSNRVSVAGGAPLNCSIYMWTAVLKNYDLRLRTYDKDATLKQQYVSSGSTNDGTGWVRGTRGTATSTVDEVSADLQLTFKAVPRGHTVYMDAALLEYGTSSAGTYFDGSSADTATVTHNWANRSTPHKTHSIESIKATVPILPTAETPTAKTLIASGGAEANPYKIGFFYTFENEVGESAPSKITEVRTSRPWSNWIWQKPNNLGEPNPADPTETAELCADQLVVSIPSTAVFDQAVAEGALKWNLYALAWSDQDPVPVVAQLIASREIYADDTSALMEPRSALYDDKGWIQVTPARRIGTIFSSLPTSTNRVNYSRPPQASNGLVAGDRLILVGDPIDLALIRWSSKQPGGYTNFSLNRGGGTKTLTSGNLNIPVSVVLWQNPQSVDTLTILCQTGDGNSATYYMNPAEVGAQTATTQIMGFEETTSTPGTTAPHGNEVHNNALWRPTDRALLKSTAQNYNISHKTVSDKIANVWWRLTAKDRITSARLDNRLYYLVYNPDGELLEKDCRGNEIWVYDVTGGEEGHWARLLIQGSALRVFSLGDREYLGVTKPGGMFYLDPEADHDEYVELDGANPKYLQVLERPIPWRFETNTQGANRAHDAWAHLQQIQVTLGNFRGKMKYGIRAHDVNHQDIDVHKVVSDLKPGLGAGSTWDIDDILQIRRDLKEWVFYGSSIDGEISFGHIGYVQYRYAPISVNIGYELGSVETFEYGSNVADGASIYSDNGIPLPVMDYSRP